LPSPLPDPLVPAAAAAAAQGREEEVKARRGLKEEQEEEAIDDDAGNDVDAMEQLRLKLSDATGSLPAAARIAWASRLSRERCRRPAERRSCWAMISFFSVEVSFLFFLRFEK
jgi:hypothetical protein